MQAQHNYISVMKCNYDSYFSMYVPLKITPKTILSCSLNPFIEELLPNHHTITFDSSPVSGSY